MQRVIRPEAGEDHQVFDRIHQGSSTFEWFEETIRVLRIQLTGKRDPKSGEDPLIYSCRDKEKDGFSVGVIEFQGGFAHAERRRF